MDAVGDAGGPLVLASRLVSYCFLWKGMWVSEQEGKALKGGGGLGESAILYAFSVRREYKQEALHKRALACVCVYRVVCITRLA